MRRPHHFSAARSTKRRFLQGTVAVAAAGAFLIVGLTAPAPAQSAPAPATKVAQPGVAPLDVPPATGNNAVITVSTGGDQISEVAVGPLAGVTLQLYNGTTSPTTPVTDSWATCVSDADGDCSFVVPNTQGLGANRDRRFWIVQTGAPTGWYTNPQLGTGSSGSTLTDYSFRTGTRLRAGSTYTSGVDFMIGTGNTNAQASGGIWQTSRDNAPLPTDCGIDVALVLDLSGSVQPILSDLKTVSTNFVDQLRGTASAVGVFTFSSRAPAEGNPDVELTPVSTADSAQIVKDQINAYTAGGGTNWDEGIYRVAASVDDYDLAIVLTDGNPTFYGDAEGPGNYTRLREIENGIFSANAVKAQGTRVVAFGIGEGLDDAGSGVNLRAISGTQADSDYFQTEDFETVGNRLRALALAGCAGSISVVKQVVPSTAAEGSIEGAQPAGGWEFAADTRSGDIAVDDPASGTTATETGAVSFQLTAASEESSGTIGVVETAQEGFTLQQVDGANAVCRDLETGAAVAVTNDGTEGFLVPVEAASAVTCDVYNRAPSPVASLTVNKEWDINGTVYPDGEQPAGLESSLTVAGTDQPWGVARTGLQQGQTPEISESPSVTLTECSLVEADLTEFNGETVSQELPASPTLVAGANTATVTNVVTCQSRLTLDKTVANGSAQADAWTLDAIAPDGALPGPSGAAGSGGATAEVTPSTPYPLAESGGDVNYAQYTVPNANLAEGSTGSWFCVQLAADGETVVPGFADGLNGAVQVPLGLWVRCTAVNQTALLELQKTVENRYGGTAVPADWELTVTPVDGVPDGVEIETRTVTGSADLIELPARPGVTYQVSEGGGPTGYEQTSADCTNADGESLGLTVTPSSLDTLTCTFVNADVPARLTLVKEVDVGRTRALEVPANWTLTATPDDIPGQEDVSGNGDPQSAGGVSQVEVSPGTYDLSESVIAGYTRGDWTCTGATVDGDSVTVALGSDVTCTIVNRAQQPTLTLVKEVDNGATGATAEPEDWTLTAGGPVDVTGASGSPEVTAVEVPIGEYELSEDGPAGFDAGDWECSGGALQGSTLTIALGDAITCTITNTAQQPTLTLVKEVDNGATGATAEPEDWTLTAQGPTPVSGTSGTPAVTGVEVEVGEYVLTEDGPAGFDAGDWECSGGALEGSTLTIALGDAITCTITNTAQQPTLTLVKEVVNDSGGAAEPEEWTLTAQGPTPVSGTSGTPAVTGVEVEVGEYVLSEDGPTGYESSGFRCEVLGEDDAPSAPLPAPQGVVTIGPGQNVVCTIINEDAAAPYTVLKTSTPGDGATVLPGDVITYTVTATTVGDGFTNDVSVVDDLSAVLDDATFVEGSIEASAGTAERDGTRLTWDIDALLGTESLTYQVRVDDGAYGATLTNVVTSPGAEPCVEPEDAVAQGVADSGPVTTMSAGDGGGWLTSAAVAAVDPAEACRTTTHVTPAWTLVKSSDPASGSSVEPGTTIRYTLTATNTTDAAVSGAVVTDDLSTVLAHGTLVDVPEGATVSGSTLTWNVPDLESNGSSATLTYAVRIAPDAWGATVTNAVTPGPGGGCDGCSTTHAVRDRVDGGGGDGGDGGGGGGDDGGQAPGFLATTGAGVLGILMTAMLLALLGGFLLRAHRRRRA